MIKVEGLTKSFPGPGGSIQALRGVNLEIFSRQSVALVGESGCGKSTLAKILIGLERPTSGQATFNGRSLIEMPAAERSRHIQMIFQDNGSALNPRKKIKDIIAEPLVIQGVSSKDKDSKVLSAMESVGLSWDMSGRFPHMLSGGQRQRIGIARALITDPDYIICDEPVSALDVSVQAQVLNLLLDLQKSRGLGLLFISHDLSVVKLISQSIAVMYLGVIVEKNTTRDLFKKPAHPYTRMLLDSLPSIHRKTTNLDLPIRGKEIDLPSPAAPPAGCAFHPRCQFATSICVELAPTRRPMNSGEVACHLAEQLDLSEGLD